MAARISAQLWVFGGNPASFLDWNHGFHLRRFGFPGSANTSNRAIQEGTFGRDPTLWSTRETIGRLQIISSIPM